MGTWSRWFRALIVGGAAATIAAALYLGGLLDGLERKSLDVRFQLFARPERADPRVVLVAIDQLSLSYFKEQKQYWPWPRDFYALLNQHVSRGGARAIVYDVLFPDPDIDRLNSDAVETDGAFADAIDASGRTVLAAHLSDDAAAGPVHARFDVDASQAALEPARFRGATAPLPVFQAYAARVGAVNYEADPDGIFRGVPLTFEYGRLTLPTLSLAALMQLEGTHRIERVGARTVRVGSTEIPLSRDGRFLAHWYGRGGPEGAFKYVSFAQLVESARLEQSDRVLQARFPSKWFEGKVVIVGSNAPGLFDFKETPFTGLEPYPGMEIHATLLSNFLRRDFLRDTDRWVTLVLLVALALGAGLLFFHAGSATRGTLAVAALEVALLGAALVAFARWDLWIEVIAPSLALVVTLLAAAIVSYVTEGRARREIRRMFDRYVSAEVVNELLRDPKSLDLGGREYDATIFFSDIADFTSISEKCGPAELIGHLNDYFSRATEELLAREGLVDKFIGDAIMAVFGVPVSSARHAQNACEAALALQRHTFRYAGDIEFVTRIGINSGKMVAGNIGSAKRLDYTVIGDSVNLASRLEGVNKVYGTRTLISEQTAALVSGAFLLRELDLLTVKGKTQPIRIFELVAQAGDVAPAGAEQVKRFHEALALYRDRGFADALAAFEKLAPDRAAAEYVARCQAFMASPPPPDWDGVFALKVK